MQNFSGLKSLYALHILHFRSDDTCIWVFRELRRFIVDNVAQHPNLPLEYLALKDSVSQLARNVKDFTTIPATDKKTNSKQKVGGTGDAVIATATGTATGAASTGGAGPVSGEESTADKDNGTGDVVAGGSEDAEEADDEDEGFLANGLKIETIDGYFFSDLPEVKIFSREIRLGKL
jgi:hypothetical protein